MNSASPPSKQPELLDPVRWALYGAALGLGAPAGLWFVLRLANPSTEEELLAYVYRYTTIATCLIFAVFGVVAGRIMARLRDASTHDPLTGLANRRLLMGQLPGLFANRARRDEPMCVLMLDLDHFKRVNDTYGHAVGDKTLVALADAILADVRKGDVVARYGGEEFVVVCPNTSERDGLMIAERIRESVSSLEEDALGFDGVQTISIGLSCTESDEDTPALVLRRADEALYEAKSNGRDRVCIYRNESVPPEDSSARAAVQ